MIRDFCCECTVNNASVAKVKRSSRGEEKGGGLGREENEEKYLSPFFSPLPSPFCTYHAGYVKTDLDEGSRRIPGQWRKGISPSLFPSLSQPFRRLIPIRKDTRYFFGKSALNNIHKVQEHKRHTTSNILISFISEIINLEILKIALMIYTLSSRIKIHQ